MKKAIVIIISTVIAAVGIAAYIYHEKIFEVSAKNIAKKCLPSYVEIDSIHFDLKAKIININGFKIINPDGFRGKYLSYTNRIVCSYGLQGGNIFKGIEVNAIEADGISINIEKLADGRLNLVAMTEEMKRESEVSVESEEVIAGERADDTGPVMIDLSKWLKITDEIHIKNGAIKVTDESASPKSFRVNIDNINAVLNLKLSPGFSEVLSVGSSGMGTINGDQRQSIRWKMTIDPKAEDLTMGSRFEANNIDILQFRQYYDEYSPVRITGGTFSGNLVFDFDNGNIGSMNTVTLKNFSFEKTKDDKSSSVWNISPDEIIKYLQTSQGEIVFDFKIKGPLDSPSFYPGPIVKNAVKNMAVDKIVGAIKGTFDQGDAGGEPSDADKVIDAIKGLF